MEKIEKLIKCLKECGFEFDFYKNRYGETEIRIPSICNCVPNEDFGIGTKEDVYDNSNKTTWTDEAYVHITINDEDPICPVDMMVEIPAPEKNKERKYPL